MPIVSAGKTASATPRQLGPPRRRDAMRKGKCESVECQMFVPTSRGRSGAAAAAAAGAETLHFHRRRLALSHSCPRSFRSFRSFARRDDRVCQRASLSVAVARSLARCLSVSVSRISSTYCTLFSASAKSALSSPYAVDPLTNVSCSRGWIGTRFWTTVVIVSEVMLWSWTDPADHHTTRDFPPAHGRQCRSRRSITA